MVRTLIEYRVNIIASMYLIFQDNLTKFAKLCIRVLFQAIQEREVDKLFHIYLCNKTWWLLHIHLLGKKLCLVQAWHT